MSKTNAIVVFTVALAFLHGCAANDQTSTRAQGAGAGAALGAGLGLLAGKDSQSALIGAGLGGLAGLALGDAVARKKSDYVSTEAMIEKEHEIVRRNADEVARYNATMRDHLDQLSLDAAALETRVATNRARKNEAHNLRMQAERDLAQGRQRLVEVNNELRVTMALYEQAKEERSVTELADWTQEIRTLERQRRDLALLLGEFETNSQQIL